MEYRRPGHLAADGLFGAARVVVQHGDDFDDAGTIADRSNFSRDGERLAAKDNVALVREAGEGKKGKKVEVQNKSTLRRRKATPKEDDFW